VSFEEALFAGNRATILAFGQTVTLNGESVTAVFDDGYRMANVGIGMSGTQPALTMLTADVEGDPVGQTVVVGDDEYTVATHEPDGTGISVLMLEAA
jgi:hypothetical protein